VAAALREVDVLALPTVAGGAPRYTEEDGRACFSDPGAVHQMCRFGFLGNLIGLPAGTAPVGVDREGVPVGLQIIGDAWDEAGVIGVLAHLERAEIASVRRPSAAVDLHG
jgi:aspartyl-tRNA(Asn)/glutamyl-tRNA(Gln) amidotransferase subunit A